MMIKKIILTFSISMLLSSNCLAQTIKTYDVKFPVLATDATSKIEVLYRMQELLRLEHNSKGEDFKNGTMTKLQWETWKEESFIPRSQAISRGIIDQKKILKKSTTYVLDITNDFTEKIP